MTFLPRIPGENIHRTALQHVFGGAGQPIRVQLSRKPTKVPLPFSGLRPNLPRTCSAES